MAKQTINQGTAPTGAGGDTFRTGSAKLQANDNELYAALGANASGALPSALPVNKGGTGATAVTEARSNLGLGTAATANVAVDVLDLGAFVSKRLIRGGDFGIGEPIGSGNAVLADMKNNLLPPAIYSVASTGATVNGFTTGVVLSLKRSMKGDNGADIGVASNSKAFKIRFINGSSESYTQWYDVYHSGNTTIDANGFIKNASPIVKLFADRIELNDEAQQQDISFEKLGTGDYLIKDSSGFAQEGWYIETPKDANGNVLFSVIYTTLENGDISVKTYKKKFDFETVSIVADLDNPVDITENRWIDLRLQELPQPEVEVVDDTEQ